MGYLSEAGYLIRCFSRTIFSYIYDLVVWHLLFWKKSRRLTPQNLGSNYEYFSKLFNKKVRKIEVEPAPKNEHKLDGFTSKRMKFTLQFEDGDVKKCFAKFPPSVRSNFNDRLFFSAFGIYETEINFCNLFLVSAEAIGEATVESKSKKIDQFPKFALPPNCSSLKHLFPEVYKAEYYRGYWAIVMEDVSEGDMYFLTKTIKKDDIKEYEGRKNEEINEEINEKQKEYTSSQLYKALQSIAKFHAIFWNNVPDLFFSYNPNTGQREGKTPMFLQYLMLKRLYNRMRGKYPDVLSNEVCECTELLIERYYDIRKLFAEHPTTLTHGDFHCNNIYYINSNSSSHSHNQHSNNNNNNNDIHNSGDDNNCNNNYINNNNDDDNKKKQSKKLNVQNDKEGGNNGGSNIENNNNEEDGYAAKFIDFQLVAREHCMKDISFHLLMSYPEDELNKNEEQIIRFYLGQLNTYLSQFHPHHQYHLSYEDAYTKYRITAIWVIFITLYIVNTDLFTYQKSIAYFRRLNNDIRRLRTLPLLRSLLNIPPPPGGDVDVDDHPRFVDNINNNNNNDNIK